MESEVVATYDYYTLEQAKELVYKEIRADEERRYIRRKWKSELLRRQRDLGFCSIMLAGVCSFGMLFLPELFAFVMTFGFIGTVLLTSKILIVRF